MKLKELRTRKYVALMIMILIVGAIVGILKIGNMDFDKGKVKVSKAVINNVTSSLSANINEAAVDNLITSKGYDEIDYVIKYSLSTDENIKERNVIIEASLDENEKYASFKDITNGDVISTVSENRKNIKITVKNAKVNKENELKLVMKLEGAPNGYKVTPKIKIKEVSEEKYTNLNVQNVEVKNNSLTGNVQDEQSMNVSNIELALKKDGEIIKKTYTDEDGNYVFSDIEEGEYDLEIDEDIYEKVSEEKVNISESTKLNIVVKEVTPYKIELKKQITEMTIVNGDKTTTYKYGNLDKVQQALRNVKNMTGEVKYKITVQNTGKKSGIVTVVKDEVPEGLTFNKEKNTSWEEKNGVLYNRSLEGITLNAGEKREEGLTLDIESTSEAKTYVNKVTAKGEIYENVVYILDGKIYKEDTVLEGEKIKEPKVDNKDFKGWYTDKKYTNKYNFNNEVTKDLVLYGQTEEIKEYTVTYVDNEKIVKTEKVKENGSLNAPKVSKEGHTFKYWSEEPNGKEYDLNAKVTKDITLYSVYDINKYTVTFINEKEKYDEQQIEYGGNIKVPTNPSKEYYTFKYWSLEENGDSYDLNTKVTKDITLYSVYDINKYTVTFIDKGKEIDKQELEAGSIVIAPEVSMEGYTFKHWSEKENGEEYNLNLPVTKNLTLYSVYEINKYNVEFYDNDKLIKTIKVDYDNTINSNEVPTVSKTGYTFTGWTENNKNFDFTTKIKENKKLYSKYEIIKNAVIFNDENRITTKKVDYNNKVEKIESQGKTGYTFKYWSLIQDGEEFDFNTLITEGITLYAVYDINEYSVNFIDQGNAYGDTQKVKYNNVAAKPETDPIKEGYTFKYWSLEENGAAYDFNTKITKDTTLYSVYSVNNYKVSFIDNEIKYIEDENIEYNKVAIKPETDPSKVGHTFKYWSLEENGAAYDFNAKITKDITLYSVYSVNNYKVSFMDNGTKYIEDETIEYNKAAIKPETDPSKVGHTFKYWSLEENGTAYDFSTKITKDTTLYSVYEANEYTVKFMDEDNLFKQEQVKYGLKVNKPSENPTKEHNLFKTWTLNDKEYDFNLPVIDNMILRSSYEEIEKPSISHVPTEWTNNKVTVTITSSHEDYKYLYKIDTGEYKEYTGPFDIDYNCTVVAKSVKENVDSITESHDITNIDKIKPIINSLNETNVSGTSFDINASTIDNESGMKQIHIYKDDLLETTIVYNENYNEEKNSTYTFNDLISGNDYKIKVIAEDVAGNLSEAKEITVKTEEKIVARIIGRENKLFEDENLYENFSSLERAIKACPSNQCTIEMVTDTKESVEVLEGQDITLNINGKTITGVKDTYTINNGGNLIIKDNAEEAGSIVNDTGVALKNETTGVLTLGELEEELVVSTTKPYINGGTFGVVNEYIDTNTKGRFNFYDGMIAGNVAIEGEVNDKPYLYNASVVTSDNRQVATLKILEDAEARIIRTGVYYTKVNEAIEDTNKGTFTESTTTNTTLMNGFKTNTMYGFTYDPENNTLSSESGKTSKSYTTIDLTGYENDQNLYITSKELSSTYGNFSITVKENDSNGTSINQTKTFDDTTEENKYKFNLEKGKRYYVELIYKINSSTEDNKVVISNISLQKINRYGVNEATEFKNISGTYNFEYDETTRTLRSNNQYTKYTTAFSYIEVDLTNETEDKEVIINASLDTLSYNNYGNIVINEDNSKLSGSSNNALAYMYVNGYSTYSSSQTFVGPYNYTQTLTKGKKYYIQFYYFKNYDNYTENNYKEYDSKDQFIINSIDVVGVGDKENIDLSTNLKTNYYGFDNYDSYYDQYTVQNDAPSAEKFDSYVEVDLTNSETDKMIDLNLMLSNYSSIYITSNNKDAEKNLIINNMNNTLLSFYSNSNSYSVNGSSNWYYLTDYKYVLPKGSIYYVHFASYYPDGRPSSYIKNISLIPITDNMINIGTLPHLKGTIDNSGSSSNKGYVIDDGTKDSNFRFIGKNTKNYVKFNDELWRVIGIFNTTDSDGNYAKRIKIVRNDSIGSNIVWDSSSSKVNSGNGVNEWSQSAVMKLLNPGYENNKVIHDSGSEIVTNNSLYWNKTSGNCLNSGGLSTSSCDFTSMGLRDSSKLMIDSVLWNTGAIINDTQNITPSQMYTYERGDKNGKTNFDASNYPTVDSVERKTTWFGKVGLPYPSDYIMASGDGSGNDRSKCMSSNSNVYGDCSSNNNWMGVNVSAPLMTMSPVYSAAFPSFTAAMITSLYTMPAANNYYVLKPSVYLNPKVKVISGNGSQTDPFILELGQEENTKLYYGLVPDLIKDDNKEEETEIKEEVETLDYTYVKKEAIYGFTYDEEKGVFTNNNKGISNTTAISYIKIDLTNATSDMPININYNLSKNDYNSMGFLHLMKNNLNKINYNDSSSYSQSDTIFASGTKSYSDTKAITLEKGNVYYLQFAYKKEGKLPVSSTNEDKFEVGITYSTDNDVTNDYTRYDESVPVLNKESDTVQILKDLSLTSPLSIENTRSMILDLNGHIISTQANDYVIKNSGDLTIIDNKYNNDISSGNNETIKNYRNNISKYVKEYDSYKITDYSQDNLELNLDGIEHGLDSTSWKDSSGKNNNITINGGATFENNYLTLDGIDDYVELGNYNYQNITIETVFEIKGRSETAYKDILYSLYGNCGYELSTSSYNVNFGYYLNSSTSLKSLKTSLSNAKDKIYYALTFDGTSIKTYMNGILMKTTAISGDIKYDENSVNNVILGASKNGETLKKQFKGNIYSARIYSRALTEEEIIKNYSIDVVRYDISNKRLTSDTSYGKVTTDSGTNPYLVFDGNTTTYWESENTSESYIQYQLGKASTLKSFKIYGVNDTSKYPSEVEVLGSKDGNTFNSIVSQKLEAKGLNEFNEINITDEDLDSYSYLKFNFKNDNNIISMGEIKLKLIDITRAVFNASSVEVSGTITSTINSVIYNESGANLNVEQGIIKLSASGNYNNITNLGNLSLKSKTKIYGNSSNNTGIYNGEEAKLDVSSSYVYGWKYGIYNLSSNKNIINVDSLGANTYALYNNGENDLEISVGNLNSNNYGIYNNSTGNINLSITSTLDLGSSGKYGIYNANTGNLDVNINNIKLTADGANGIYNKSTGNINGVIKKLYVTSSPYSNAIEQNTCGVYNNSTGKISLSNSSISTSGYGIYNNSSGELNLKSTTISHTNAKGYTTDNTYKYYGIYDNSGVLDLDSTKITIPSSTKNPNGYAIYMVDAVDLKFVNSEISNYSYGIYNTNSSSSLTIESGTINSTNSAVYNGGGTVTIGSENTTPNITGNKYAINNPKGILTINNGSISSSGVAINSSESYYTTSSSIYINGGTITGNTAIDINGSSLDVNSGTIVGKTYGINNEYYRNTMNINESNISAESDKGIGVLTKSPTVITNSKILASGSQGCALEASKDLSLSNVNIETTGISSYGLILDSGTLNFESSTISSVSNGSTGLSVKNGTVNLINGSIKADAYGVINSGTVILGEKDGVVTKQQPSIVSNNYGIYASSNSIEFYDGVITGSKENVFDAIVSDSEDNYDLYITPNSKNTSKVDVTLEIPTKEKFGEVAEVDGVTYPSVKSAFDSITSDENKIVKLLKSTKTILNLGELSKNISINTNGNTISYFGSNTYLTNKNTLNIYSETGNDSGIISKNPIIVDNYGTLTTNNSSENYLLSRSGNNYIIKNNVDATANINSGVKNIYVSDGTFYYHNSVDNYGTLIINNSYIYGMINNVGTSKISNSNLYSNDLFEGYRVKSETINNTGNLIIDSSNVYSYDGYGIYNDSGTIDISQGIVYDYVASGSAIYNKSGEVTLANVDIQNTKSDGTGIYNYGTVTLESGKVSGNYGVDNRGTFNMKDGIVKVIDKGVALKNEAQNSIANIYAGEISTLVKNSAAISSAGEINIYGGNIIANGISSNAINIVSGTLNLGIKGDGAVSISNPSIEATKNGITNQYDATFNFYDGKIVAQSAITGTVNEIEDGYSIVGETLDDGRELKYLDKVPIIKNLATNKKYISLFAAVNEASSGDTLQYIAAATVLSGEDTAEIVSDKEITIDINGNSISINNDLYIDNKGTLKIIDSKNTKNEDGSIEYGFGRMETTGESLIKNTGNLVIDSVVITGKENTSNLISNTENGSLKIENTKASFSNKYYSDDVTIVNGIYNSSNNEVIINNTKINNKGSDSRITGYALYNDESGKVKITDSDFTLDDDIYHASKSIYNNANGTINADNSILSLVVNNSLSDVTLGNCTLSNISNNLTGNINLIKGSIKNAAYYDSANVYNKSKGTVNIDGTNIKLQSSSNSVYSIRNYNGVVNIDNATLVSSKSIYNESGTININGSDLTGNVKNISSAVINIGKVNSDNLTTMSSNIDNTDSDVFIYNGSTVSGIISTYKGNIYAYNGSTTYGIENRSGFVEIYGTVYGSDRSVYNFGSDVGVVGVKIYEGSVINNTIENYKGSIEIYGGTLNKISNDLQGTINIRNAIVDNIKNAGIINMYSGSILSSDEAVVNERKFNLYGGSVESTASSAISSASGSSVTNIGTKGDVDESNNLVVSNESPIVKGKDYGILAKSGQVNFYDGKIIGKKSISGDLYSTEIGYDTVTITDADENEVTYLSIQNYVKNLSTNKEYSDLQTAINEASNGDLIQFTNDKKFLSGCEIINIDSNKNIIIDINGKNISYTNQRMTGLIINNGRLKIIDSVGNGLMENIDSKMIENNGTLEIDGANLSSKNSPNHYGTTIRPIVNAGTLIVTSGTINSEGSSVVNSGEVTINGGTLSSITNTGTLNVNGGNISSINNTGTATLLGGTISSGGIYNSSKGILTVGEKDGIVNIANPVIQGTANAVSNEGIFNFYDGKLVGNDVLVSGKMTEIEPGYKLSISDDTTNNTKVGYLVVIADDERVAMVNGINFTSLQTAINSVKDNTESNIVIYKDIELTEDIIVPENKIINLYLNGHTITYGDYSFVKNGTLTIIDSTPSDSIGASIINTIEKVLNINQNGKNIIVYEMSDGSKLSTENTYNLYKKEDKEYKKLNMETDEEVGRYITGSNNSEMTSIKGRIYLNNLEEGSYKLVSSDNKDIEFTITEDGKLNGNILENTNEKRKVIETAFAYLIITIQTGVNQIKYIIYIVAIVSIILGLYFAFKEQKKLSRKV